MTSLAPFLHSTHAVFFSFARHFLSFGSSSCLGGFLSAPSLLDFFLDAPEFFHLSHVLLLFYNLEYVIVWLPWLLSLVSVVLHKEAFLVEKVLKRCNVDFTSHSVLA